VGGQAGRDPKVRFGKNPPKFSIAKFVLPKNLEAFGAISFVSYVFLYGLVKKNSVNFKKTF
jgi:hypothetical protein